MKYHMLKTDPLLDKCFFIIGWVCVGLAFLLFVGWNLGLSRVYAAIPPCALHQATGYYCPGCGGTRAFVALCHGKVLTSLYYHPIVCYGTAVGGWFLLSQTIERLSRKKVAIGMHYRDVYLWIALVIVVLNCLVKNLVLAITGIVPMA